MFRSARLKLTAWYLAIIMSISLLFSLIIYLNINTEFQRFERLQKIIAQEENSLLLPLHQLRISRSRLDAQTIRAARARLVTALGISNLAILGLAGTAGYFLAGRTLGPIQQMVDEQNRFIGDASHELKTPLTSLKSALEVYLRNKKRTLQEADDLAAESIAEVNKLQTLTESLLTLAQFQKSNMPAETKETDISEVIVRSVKQVSPMALKKNIKINNKVGHVTVKGYEEQLSELFVILLDNAIKYSDPKTTIDISCRHIDNGIAIAVKDEGIGIFAKDIPKIFDRFYRADSARSKNGTGGYGLGLSIAKYIAETHAGSITVKSRAGHGSTFTVTLPARFS